MKRPTTSPGVSGPLADGNRSGSRCFCVDLSPRGEDGSVHARIVPVADFTAAVENAGLRLSDAVLDVISEMVAELARQDMNDGGHGGT